MIQCPLCQASIGFNAKTCPKCGGDVAGYNKVLGMLMLFAILFFIGGWFYPSGLTIKIIAWGIGSFLLIVRWWMK